MSVIKFIASIVLFVPGFVNGFRIQMLKSAGDRRGAMRLEGNWIARASKKVREM